MASMVAWTSMESIGRILWKWSPIAPWIPHKLSVEYMETNRKRRKLMPLNNPLNLHCFFGSPWKCSLNTPWKWQWDPRNSMDISESKSILVFVMFLYGISLSQNIFVLLQGTIRPQNLLTFLVQIIFF